MSLMITCIRRRGVCRGAGSGSGSAARSVRRAHSDARTRLKRKQETVLKATAVRSPVPVMSLILWYTALYSLHTHRERGPGRVQAGGSKLGGRGHFIHLAMYCTTTWCFTLKGLRTTKQQLTRLSFPPRRVLGNVTLDTGRDIEKSCPWKAPGTDPADPGACRLGLQIVNANSKVCTCKVRTVSHQTRHSVRPCFLTLRPLASFSKQPATLETQT